MLAYLNFPGAPDSPQELDKFLWGRLSTHLKENEPALTSYEVMQKVFARDIQTVASICGPSGTDVQRIIADKLYDAVHDDERFAKAALRYCTANARLPIILFDNVDQLSIQVQTEIFSRAQLFANHLGCLSIVVLREESYSAALMKRHLTAYNVRPYHLSSPTFKDLLRMRVDFAVNAAVKDDKSVGAPRRDSDYASVVDLFRSFTLCALWCARKSLADLAI